jgi:A/G-specific adenine glycosylase
MTDIAHVLVPWQRQHGRHGLPWQGTDDPYRVWLSEIMLQQTQVATVLGYYQRFLQRFPSVEVLAVATEDELMPYWAGLGYYNRARNLLACARLLVQNHQGRFPLSVEALSALPGIGRSTAGAVVSLAGGQVAPILDGNVRRVFARYFGIHGHTALPAVQTQLWALAEQQLPGASEIKAYNQGLMDLGATVCVRSKPRCDLCPLRARCVALREGLTRVLPTPKPRINRREEYFEVRLNRDGARIWLEPRPAKGVWAGLWMAPMVALAAGAADRPPDLVHELTHRRYCLYATATQAASGTGRWFDLPLAPDAPVPASLHKLLAAVPQGLPLAVGVDDPVANQGGLDNVR